MSHIANHRIKKGGKYYAPGEPIELTEEDLAELPDDAVHEAEPEDASADETGDTDKNAADVVNDEAEKLEALKKAVAGLPDSAFKKDGDIRADALKALNDQLGFETNAAAVALVKPATE